MPNKIYWCKEAGTVYWIEDGGIMYAPMNNDSTANLADGGAAEVWDECPVTKDQVLAKLGREVWYNGSSKKWHVEGLGIFDYEGDAVAAAKACA